MTAEGFAARTVLDIGGGVGVVQHELATRGATRLTDVDASQAYLDVAKKEAHRRGYGERARYLYGDFVDVASQVESADLVTLDRVVCCYPDASALLHRAAERAKGRLGLVWPRDRWWTRLAARGMNSILVVTRNPFRMRIHPDNLVHGELERAGLIRQHHQRAGFWQVAVYERPSQ
ncbi:MAG: class I SAM-dependent methyltransferase [Candidatus Thermoplasmatota archaeon]